LKTSLITATGNLKTEKNTNPKTGTTKKCELETATGKMQYLRYSSVGENQLSNNIVSSVIASSIIYETPQLTNQIA